MKITFKKSIYYQLDKFDYLEDKDSYIDITDWTNGEGYDINICSKNQYKHIELTEGEIDAITYLTTTLRYNLSDS